MSTLVQMYKGCKSYGTKILFDNAGFSINEGEHVGVIGPNGAGKTTLFKTLVGHESLDSGDLVFSNQLRIGYLEQDSDWQLDQIAEEYLAENCITKIWDLKQQGISLGLTQQHFSQPLKSLSGGYRMRMKLLYLIGQEPNLMLLDEPTNYLDLESVLALELFLQNYNGAFLLISHDREFLRRTTDATLEVESGEITKFPGNIDDYFEQKTQLRTILEAQAANQEAKRQEIQSFVDRFRAKATKAKQAQSRMKLLDKMTPIEIKNLPIKANIRIPEPIRTGKEVLQLTNADLGYNEEKIILKNVNIRMTRETHLGVVGVNGAGKSTLLKTIGKRISLLAGSLNLNTEFSYFAQHVAEDLPLDESILEVLQKTAHPEVKSQEILDLAGSLLFSGSDIYKKIKVLSGGEKSRVALAQILLKKNPLLILDEPTNHLDFDTVEALTESLRTYPGALIIVSHDRGFIGRIATQILEINNGKAEIYPGTYDEYVWSVEQGALKERNQQNQQSTTTKTSNSSTKNSTDVNNSSSESAPKQNYKEITKKLQSEIREYNKKISQLENKISEYSNKRDELNTNIILLKGLEAQEVAKQIGMISQDIESQEDELLLLMETLQEKETALQVIRQTY